MTQAPALLQFLRFERLSDTLAQFLWQGALIAAIAAAANLLLARRRPEIRYAAFCAALLAMLVTAGVTLARWTPRPVAASRASGAAHLAPAPETARTDTPAAAAMAGIVVAAKPCSRNSWWAAWTTNERFCRACSWRPLAS